LKTINLDKLIKLDGSEWAHFEKCIIKEKLAKNEQIIKKGKHCNFIAVIHEGSFRVYYDEYGEEKITTFNFKGNFVTNYWSFFNT
jgi:hypothetical protein